MRHLIVVSLELADPNAEEAEFVREALEKINLTNAMRGSEGKVFDLPPNTFAGTVEGDDTVAIADQVLAEARAAITHLGLDGNVFVSVGQQWVWRGQHLHGAEK